MEQTGCSETLSTKLHTPEKIPKEKIQLSKQGESQKSESRSCPSRLLNISWKNRKNLLPLTLPGYTLG
jgi:hypothetical protein